MRREQIEAFKTKCQANLTRPGAKEIARFLGKRAGRLDLWGLLPRSPDRWYTSELTLRGTEWRSTLTSVVGDDITEVLARAQAQPAGEWVTLLNHKSGTKIRLCPQQDHTTTLEFYPLTMMTTMLERMVAGGQEAAIVSVERPCEGNPWTAPTDKLSQAEFYYARESTDDSRRCVNCDGPLAHMCPLSSSHGGERTQQWWCTGCRGFHPHYQPEVEEDDDIRDICESRQLPTDPFLGDELQWEDFEYYLEHLPRHKAAGCDGVPYEVLRGASLTVRRLLFQCVQQLLRGEALPTTWAKGTVRLLEKREPIFQLENLRPVTLLRTAYKLHTGIVNNRLQWALESAGVLEPNQDGFRPGRHTRKAAVRLQYFLEESKRNKKEVYIAYMDWFSAFCSVPHSKLFQMLRWSGMHDDDIAVLEQIQANAHLKVATDFGDTCDIPITRGTPQGDTLSPTLFSMFINVCLRSLARNGVGFEHACGVRGNASAFADDIALMTNTVKDMNILLERLRTFASWSGMQLNLKKCEVTGFCYQHNRERDTDTIRYDGACLEPLRGSKAFKYLGIRVAANQSTREERKYVREAAVAVARLSRHHPYHPYQMESILRTAVRPVFNYSAPLTTWSHAQLRDLERVWARVHKNCWNLTTGHHSAPFQLGPQHGGIADNSIYTLRAKECVGLLSNLAAHGDDDILKLVQQEATWLQQEWGTTDPWQLQLCLLLGDAPDQYPTLLAQTMMALGHTGMTWQWNKVQLPFVDVENDEGILTFLEGALWAGIQRHWATGEDELNLHLVARAIKHLQAQGINQLGKIRRGARWHLEPHWMPIRCAEALLHLLEMQGGGTRTSVHEQLRSEHYEEDEQIRLEIPNTGYGRRGPRQRRRPPPVLFEGLGEIAGPVQATRNRQGQQEYRVALKTYAQGTPIRIRDAPDLEDRVLLFNHAHFPAAQSLWPGTSPTGHGWWVRVSRSYKLSRQWYVDVDYLDATEKGKIDSLPVARLIKALRQQADMPPTVDAWVTAEQLGERRLAVGSRLPRSVQTFWEEERRQKRPIPEEIGVAMASRDMQMQRDPRRTWRQGGLPYIPDRPMARESWESTTHHARQRGPALDPATCVLRMEGQTAARHEIPCSTREGLPVRGEVRLEQARIHLYHGDLKVWTGERAKWMQWAERDRLTPTDITTVGTTHADHTTAMEGDGYRSITWQIQTQIQQQMALDTVVGPSAWEACPTFPNWISGFDATVIPPDATPMLMLGAIPEEFRYTAVVQALAAERWAVIWPGDKVRWRDGMIEDRVLRMLEDNGRHQDILEPDSLKVYQKGWSQSGDKQQHKGGRLRMWTSPGRPKPTLTEGAYLPPIVPDPTAHQGDCRTYTLHLPSGPYLANEGLHCWTDGSVHTGGETSGAGVWFRPAEEGVPDPISTSIGGEPVIIRGELGAMTLALQAAPLDQSLTLYTDSLSSLWIIRRWLRHDFGFCLDNEGHADLVRELVQVLHQRRAVRTELVWVPSHAGDPGNEVADVEAKAGVDTEVPAFDRICPDMEFWSPDRELINFLGWRTSTARWANQAAWRHTAEHLRQTSKAISTQSLLRTNRSRPALGKALQNKDRCLTERAVRRMLQARGFNTPVQATLSRNSRGTVSAICPFCKQEEETLGHFQMACRQFADARCAAHNEVANTTIQAVHEEIRKMMTEEQKADTDLHPTLWLDTSMQHIYPELRYTKEGTFRPDGLVVDHHNTTVHVLELTRGMEADEWGWRLKEDKKIAAYHATALFLQAKHPGYTIRQSTFIVGVLGSVVDSEWSRTLTSVGIDAPATQRVIEKTVLSAIRALDATLNARQAAREALGGGGSTLSPHPSQRDRPPARVGGLAAP